MIYYTSNSIDQESKLRFR